MPMTSSLQLASFGLIGFASAATNCCKQPQYAQLVSLSQIPAVQAFCTAKFPLARSTTTSTSTAVSTVSTTVSTVTEIAGTSTFSTIVGTSLSTVTTSITTAMQSRRPLALTPRPCSLGPVLTLGTSTISVQGTTTTSVESTTTLETATTSSVAWLACSEGSTCVSSLSGVYFTSCGSFARVDSKYTQVSGSATSVQDCRNQCASRSSCNSFNYNGRDNSCLLADDVKGDGFTTGSDALQAYGYLVAYC
ncbi:hypothetical protein TI39_contig264g00025 [Zymoseptoria brevis]|uniref:Apple domain-containing protein n=1 Tax=Zymoseptoria brevis TaxID=1047168 RepID=A0A0F4GX70_9PEZI|nr:hypothetical protein TI39_contig264g00025 [Zymoseptoria brevis]